MDIKVTAEEANATNNKDKVAVDRTYQIMPKRGRAPAKSTKMLLFWKNGLRVPAALVSWLIPTPPPILGVTTAYTSGTAKAGTLRPEGTKSDKI